MPEFLFAGPPAIPRYFCSSALEFKRADTCLLVHSTTAAM